MKSKQSMSSITQNFVSNSIHVVNYSRCFSAMRKTNGLHCHGLRITAYCENGEQEAVGLQTWDTGQL